MPVTAKRPHMDARQAKHFDHGESSQQYVTVKTALLAKGCHACEPYTDVFTFARWVAQGMHVKKGEHGIHISVFVEIKDDAGNVTSKRPWTSTVFCRCQVERSIRHG